MLFWLCSRELIFSLTLKFSNERNVEEFLFLDKNLKIQESLCTLVVSGSLSIRFLFTTISVQWNCCLAFRWGKFCGAQLHPCAEKLLNCITFWTSLPYLVDFFSEIDSSGPKEINLLKITFVGVPLSWLGISARPINANNLDSLWWWNSSLFSTPGFCSAVGFMFAKNALFYDSQNLSFAAENW